MEKLAVVSRAVSMRPTVQILSGIWLQANEGTLELAATDMELSLRSSLQADISAPGTVVVPGDRDLLAAHAFRRRLPAPAGGRRRTDVLRRA